MKKVLALTLALCMVFTLGITAFAATGDALTPITVGLTKGTTEGSVKSADLSSEIGGGSKKLVVMVDKQATSTLNAPLEDDKLAESAFKKATDYNSEDEITDVNIGDRVYILVVSDDEDMLIKGFGTDLVKKTNLKERTLTDFAVEFPTPLAGDLGSAYKAIVADDAPYTVAVTKVVPDGGSDIKATGKFVADKKNVITATLTAKDGYVLTSTDGDINVSVSGATLTTPAPTYGAPNITITVETNPTQSKGKISSVTLPLKAPVTGATPEAVKDIDTTDYKATTVTWTPSDAKFLADKAYAVSVVLTSKDGREFNTGITFGDVKIDGLTVGSDYTVTGAAVSTVGADNDTLTVGITFAKTQKTEIGKIEATVKTPVAGAAQNKTVTAKNGCTVSNVTWSPAEKFAAGKEYTVSFDVKTDANSQFASAVTATVNGSNATVAKKDDTTYTVSYKFASLVAADKAQLEKLITEAATLRDSVEVSAKGDGSDIAEGKNWVTSVQLGALKTAIRNAEDEIDNTSATDATTLAQVVALQDAIDTFKGQIQGGSGSEPVGPTPTPTATNTPSGGGSHHSGGGSSSSGGSSYKGVASRFELVTSGGVKVPTTSTVTSVSTSAAKAAATTAVASAVKAGNDTAVVSFQNAQALSPAAINEVSKAADAKNIDATIAVKKVVDGKTTAILSFDAASYASTSSIRTGVTVNDAAAVAKFSKAFPNNKIAAVKFDQRGEFGATVTLKAAVNLTGMNAKTLVFYTYDPATGKATRLTDVEYTVDANGVLTFSTNVGNYIIISDKPLAK